MNFVYLIIGFALLIKGADWLVDSAAKLAKSLGISSLIIGLSVVAFGTSAPEATVGIFSGLKHTNAVTLGDVIGSSIANVALIIGISAILSALSVDDSLLKKEIPVSFAVQVLLVVLAIIGSTVSRLDGVFFLVLFLVFLYYLWKSSGNSSTENVEEHDIRQKSESEPEPGKSSSDLKYKLKLLLLLIVGLACLVFGGNIVVDSSVGIARSFGLSEALIGVTIVALGTSLPELVTCVVASRRKESDIAVGNIIGSNIFNVLFVLGLSSVINPIRITEEIYADITAMLVSTILLFMLSVFKKRITRLSGLVLVGFYVMFIVYKVMRIY